MFFIESITLKRNCFNANLIVGNQKLKHPIHSKILWYVAYVEDCMNGMAPEDEETGPVSDSEAYRKTNFQNKVNDTSDNSLNSITIQPNPASNSFKIISNFGNISNINLKDLKGNIIMNNLEKKLNQNIDINSLASGVYLDNVEQNNEYKVSKLIKL